MSIVDFLAGIVASVIAGVSIMYFPKVRERMKRYFYSENSIIHENNTQWNRWAFSNILEKKVKNKNAFFIDYSGFHARTSVYEALEKGWKVHLIIRDIGDDLSPFQKSERFAYQKEIYCQGISHELKKIYLLKKWIRMLE